MIYIYLVPQMSTALYYMHMSLVCILDLVGRKFLYNCMRPGLQVGIIANLLLDQR